MKRIYEIIILLLFPIMLFSQSPYQIKADCDKKVQEINNEISKLNNDYNINIAEMRQGLFCSVCLRSKTLIEQSGTENFYQHIHDVHGEVIPATAEQINQVTEKYNSDYNRLKNKFDRQQDDCNRQVRDAYDNENRERQEKEKENEKEMEMRKEKQLKDAEREKERIDQRNKYIEEQNRIEAQQKQDAINQYNAYVNQLQQKANADLNNSIQELKQLTEENTRQTEVLITSMDNTISQLKNDELKSKGEVSQAAEGAFDGLLGDEKESASSPGKDNENTLPDNHTDQISNPEKPADAIAENQSTLSQNSIFSVTRETIADVSTEEALTEILNKGSSEYETYEMLEATNSLADLLEDPDKTLSDNVKHRLKEIFIENSNNSSDLVKRYIKHNEEIINNDGQIITSTLEPMQNAIESITSDDFTAENESGHNNLSDAFDRAVHAMSPEPHQPSDYTNYIKNSWRELSPSQKGLVTTGAVGGVLYMAGAPLTVPASIILFTMGTIAFMK